MNKKLSNWLKGLSEEEAKEYLGDIIENLDDFDQEDQFGTEGWRHYFGLDGEIP